MDNFNVIFYSVIAGVSTLVGTFLVIKFGNWAKKNMIFLISLATGILLATAFLDILPEALELNNDALLYVLVSILALYALEQRIIIHSCHDEECRTHHAKDTVSVLGLGLHSLIDGLIIGAGFSASTEIGIIASIGVILHEIPEGISIYSILTAGGVAFKKKIVYSSIVAVATPIGAILSVFIFKDLSASNLGIWLALAAGCIIYIAASDLIPETHEKFHKLNILFVLFGVAIIYLLTLLFHV